MPATIPFVNREPELAHIDDLIQAWGTRRVLFISGAPGSGKTRLLSEIQQRYAARHPGNESLLITDVIDFHNPLLRIRQNLGAHLARMLDAKLFDPYLFVLNNWHKMRLSVTNSEQLEQSSRALTQTFVNCFNMVSVHRRVLLFMDTIDKVGMPDLLQYMLISGKQLDNVVLFMAGRHIDAIHAHVRAELDHEVSRIDLQPFSPEASAAYLQHKQRQLDTPIAPGLLGRINTLAAGRTVFLDLGAEWATRHSPPAWLTEPRSEQLQDERERYQLAFERMLVESVARPDTPSGRLLLSMARIDPLDGDGISSLLQLSPEAAETVLHEARQSAWVRQLPRNKFSLHLDVQRIINNVIWPVIDPDFSQRRADSQWAAAHLETQINTLLAELAVLRTRDASVANQPAESEQHESINFFMQAETLEQQLWQHQAERLRHTLCADVQQGLALFHQLFNEATRQYFLQVRGTFFSHLEPYIDQLTATECFAVEVCRVEQLLDDGQYHQVRQLVGSLLEQEIARPEQIVELLLHQGNAEIRMGYLDQSVAHFDRAIRVCRVHDLRQPLVRAINARGWAYRNQGRHEQALNDHLEAYQRSLHIDDLEQTAWVLTNISFISTLRGDRQAAYEGCQTALKLWHSVELPRGLAAGYVNLGEFYVRFNEPHEAMGAYSRALDIFEREQDADWLPLVHCGRAFAYHSLGELDKAAAELDWAAAHGPVNLKTRILYSQGLIAWDRGDLQQAREKLEECRKLSQEIGDIFHDFKSFADLVELAWEAGEFERWRGFSLDLEDLYREVHGEDGMRLRGSCLRKIGDLAICYGDYDAALDFYEEGFPLLAQYETYDRYTIRSQMKQTNERILHAIPTKILSRLGIALEQFWRSNPVLVVKYPEALLTFHTWKRQGDPLLQGAESAGDPPTAPPSRSALNGPDSTPLEDTVPPETPPTDNTTDAEER
jgi:tetratricopeptide (TPR) repeat protein